MQKQAVVPFDDYLKKEQECEKLKETIEEKNAEIEELKQHIENILQDRNENYRKIGEYELYGISERNFV